MDQNSAKRSAIAPPIDALTHQRRQPRLSPVGFIPSALAVIASAAQDLQVAEAQRQLGISASRLDVIHVQSRSIRRAGSAALAVCATLLKGEIPDLAPFLGAVKGINVKPSRLTTRPALFPLKFFANSALSNNRRTLSAEPTLRTPPIGALSKRCRETLLLFTDDAPIFDDMLSPILVIWIPSKPSFHCCLTP
jgi:hypothetical protein